MKTNTGLIKSENLNIYNDTYVVNKIKHVKNKNKQNLSLMDKLKCKGKQVLKKMGINSKQELMMVSFMLATLLFISSSIGFLLIEKAEYKQKYTISQLNK